MTTPDTAGLPELLPCPFCGLEPKQSDRPDSYTPTKHVWFIACFCGGYSACAHKMGETQSEVLTKWNTRAAQAAQPTAPMSGNVAPVCPESSKLIAERMTDAEVMAQAAELGKRGQLLVSEIKGRKPLSDADIRQGGEHE